MQNTLTETTQESLGIDLGIVLSPLEIEVVKQASLGKTPKTISTSLGIPITTIQRLLNKKEIKGALEEMTEVRNRAIVAYLPTLLMDIIEDKVRVAEDNGDSIGQTSKRDIVDIAKTISDIVKGTSTSTQQETNGLTAFYQTFNMVAKEN